MSADSARFVLARHGQFVVVAAPDPAAPGTWLCDVHEPGGPDTHRPPFREGKDGTWALVRKRLGLPPDPSVDANHDCRAVRIAREICPYLQAPKRGEYVTSFQWNGRLRTLVRPQRVRGSATREAASGGGVGSADADVGPGGLAAHKPENQR